MFNLIYQLITIICLCIGFYFGYTIGKTQRFPKYKSVGKIIRERKEEMEKQKKEKEVENKYSITEQYLENINNYPNNQKKIIEE